MSFKQTQTHEFNKRVSLQSPTIVEGSTGESVKTWPEGSTYATVWAKIRSLSGNERFAAQQVQATVSHEVTIRYSSDVADVAPDDRIVYGSRYFDIKNVRNVDEANIEIRMIVNESI